MKCVKVSKPSVYPFKLFLAKNFNSGRNTERPAKNLLRIKMRRRGRRGKGERRELKRHLWNLYSLTDGEIGEEPPEEEKEKWNHAHPNLVLEYGKRRNRKDGKHYKKTRIYQMTGIPYIRKLIRCKHQHRWSKYKQIIAPISQLHHEWVPGTADYKGVALVEADQHLHGFIDVIQILEGEITLFTEAQIRRE